jgi:hypothetical protein
MNRYKSKTKTAIFLAVVFAFTSMFTRPVLPAAPATETESQSTTASTAVSTGHDRNFAIMTIPVEVKPPADEVDETVEKQLDYLLKIPGLVDDINRTDFFKPYNSGLKEKIAGLLRQAADIEADDCHKRYLNQLAAGVLADDFYTVVPEWFTLEKNKSEIVFLADEKHLQRQLFLKLYVPIDWSRVNFQELEPERQYRLKGLQPGEDDEYKIFDTIIYVNDEEQTWKFREFTRRFEEMQNNLPFQKAPVVPYTARAPSIKIGRLVYSSIPRRISLVYPTWQISHIYQDYPRHQTFKIVIFKNLIDAYVECILKPIGKRILLDTAVYMEMDTDTKKRKKVKDKKDTPEAIHVPVTVNSDSYLINLVLQKIAHHMGPVFTIRPKQDSSSTGGGKTDVKANQEMELRLFSDLMGPTFFTVEEIKARAAALQQIPLLKKEGLIPGEKQIGLYAAYLVSLVNRVRIHPTSANRLSRADMIQFNYLLKKGAIFFNINSKKISIEMHLFQAAVEELAKLSIQKSSEFFRLISEYGQLTPELTEILKSLEDIPVKTEFQLESWNDGG